MRRLSILGIVAAATLLLSWTQAARALEGYYQSRNDRAFAQAPNYPWHGSFYDPAWGMPVALVVPPTAECQTHYGWGVGNTRITQIDHQFRRGYPGPGVYDRRYFLPTPPQPSDTDQFGVYYIRGPW
jgi:hypothetical protein